MSLVYRDITITLPSIPFSLALPVPWQRAGAPAAITLFDDASPPAATMETPGLTNNTAAFQHLEDAINWLVTVTGRPALTSLSSATLGLGSVSLIVDQDASTSALVVSDRVLIAVGTGAAPKQRMEGVITAYTGTTLTVDVDRIQGSGTFAAWNISVVGGKVTAEEFLRLLLTQPGVTYALPEVTPEMTPEERVEAEAARERANAGWLIGFRYWLASGGEELPLCSCAARKTPDGRVVVAG